MDRKWWTLTAVSVGIFMLLARLTIVNVALPDIQRDLDRVALGPAVGHRRLRSHARRAAADRRVAGGPARPPAGVRHRHRVLHRRLAARAALATDPSFLSLARAFQGIGGAIMFATALALIAHAFRGRERGVAFGVFGAVTGVAVAVGPVLGGVITSGLAWRWIFFVNIPIGVAAIAMTLLRVDESRDPLRRRPDWIGFVTFSGALAALVYGLIRANADGWGSPLIVGCLAGAALLLGAFVVAELVAERSRCSTSRCCASRRSSAGWSPRSRSRRRCSRC